MRNLSILGLTCIAAMSGPVAAEEAVVPDPQPRALHVGVAHGTSPAWTPRNDRLSYLHASPCSSTGRCSLRPAALEVAERDYIRSLDLVTYGPMNLKFTGNRVKLKVRF